MRRRRPRIVGGARRVRDAADRDRLVDEITYKKASEATDVATQSAILGPFYRQDHPIREKDATISFNAPEDAEAVYMYGQVLDAKTKKPLSNAKIDVWEASTNGEAVDWTITE